MRKGAEICWCTLPSSRYKGRYTVTSKCEKAASRSRGVSGTPAWVSPQCLTAQYHCSAVPPSVHSLRGLFRSIMMTSSTTSSPPPVDSIIDTLFFLLLLFLPVRFPLVSLRAVFPSFPEPPAPISASTMVPSSSASRSRIDVSSVPNSMAVASTAPSRASLSDTTRLLHIARMRLESTDAPSRLWECSRTVMSCSFASLPPATTSFFLAPECVDLRSWSLWTADTSDSGKPWCTTLGRCRTLRFTDPNAPLNRPSASELRLDKAALLDFDCTMRGESIEPDRFRWVRR
mmetsp:Transcript_22548/g.63285  ORF Transcript_22548/g.63285 Transcript_22548/m.63285 type:complete len:288 (+) Transcript_22548:106-969(+)